ncbi:trypsin, alkaline B-like [Pectinophora gossypiella]|uniref:Peptidase S1 domain-containing protein n=1 Tax=Pectinophora gossypiella TaxID=13191 RepID=A0A1E1WH25_PECGO|nr:trypsin, alkaline B-like [Pectinophora gossypiella]
MWNYIVLLLAITYCLCDDAERNEIILVDLASTAPTIGSRIIGGMDTTIERYPYAVQVLQSNQLSCGGSLITRLMVLSAAHCFVSNGQLLALRNFRIRCGTTRLNSGGTTRSISRVIPHERYNNPLRDNDVAVVVMNRRVTLGRSIAQAALPYQGQLVPNSAFVIHVGWGRTNPYIATPSTILQEVVVNKINNTVCRQRYALLEAQFNQPFPVTSSMICAGILDVGGRDACQGDSGGPLIYNGVVVGVTSWGYGCAQAYAPGVSARVSNYTNWILDTVQRNGAGNSNTSGIALLSTFICALCSLLA